MHELSLVMSIIRIAESESTRHGAGRVEEIELEIGALSGVEQNAFDFAWSQAVRDTLLEHARREIRHIPAEGVCTQCDTAFPMEQLYDPCPACGDVWIDIRRGREMRVKSLVIS